MQYRNLSDVQLEFETKKSVLEENKIQMKTLHLLAEIDRRRLYSKTYPSLFEYCLKTLKLSCGSAQRRIDTMRAMKLIPEIESKILTGNLNLSAVSKAQTFFRQEKKLGKAYSVADKKELLEKLENKSSKECIKEFVAISPQAVIQEKRRDLTPSLTELKIVIDQDLIQKLDQLKALWSHQNPTMTDLELLQKMANLCLKHTDPAQKKVRAPKQKVKLQNTSAELKNHIQAGDLHPSPPLAEVDPRYIPAKIKHQVWIRDQGQCTFPGCGSKHFLEYDHIQPISFGGRSNLENLRLLCRAHNQQAAIQHLGFQTMSQFIN